MSIQFLSSIFAVLFLIGCASRPHSDNPEGTICAQNLHKLGVELRAAIPVAPEYPGSLADLATVTTNRSLFTCPNTRRPGGDLKIVEDWSNYIYVANLPDLFSDTHVALLICPPENHSGNYGYVLWLDGVAQKLSAPDIRNLIATP